MGATRVQHCSRKLIVGELIVESLAEGSAIPPLGVTLGVWDRNAQDVGCAGTPQQIDKSVGYHFLFLCIPFLPLPMDINPNSDSLIISECAISDFGRDGSELFLLVRVDENSRVGPASI